MPLPLSGTSATDVGNLGLDVDFAGKLSSLLSRCHDDDLDFKLSQAVRSPQVQAEYYCQWEQRSPAQIDAAAKQLEDDGAPWLASLLRKNRDIPRSPDWLTSALPGAGWHQWGLAADCYCYRDGKMVKDGNDPCYKQYAAFATKLGLTAGYNFKKHQDSGHVQGPSAIDSTSIFKWAHIDAVMKARFGDKDTVAPK